MVRRWRQALHEIGPEIFSDQRDPMSRRKALGYEPGESPDDLKKLIGELTMQNDILKKSERHCWANEQAAQNGGGAHTACAPRSPINKSPLARVLGIARSSLYLQLKRPKQDKALAVRIEAAHEKDDTMGYRKLAALLGTGKNRIRRVMHTYGIAAQSLREARMSTEASQPRLCRSQLREEAFEWVGNEVVFSDILEVKRADGTRVRGCFALRHRTRQVLLIAFDYHTRADLVTDTTPTMAFEVPGSIWQSEEAQTIWGGPDPLLALAKRLCALHELGWHAH